ILSQIKKSYFANLEEKKTSGVLNKIFNNAIAVGKKFRSQSSILEKGLSLEGIAVKFIENHFDDIKDKHVFVIGLGDLAQSIIYILIKEGVKNITVTNRSLHKNLTIKQKFDVATASFSEKYDFINFSDIIISATSAPHCIIKKDELEKYLTIDKKRFFLDLAVPRDIEDHIIQIEGVNLYNIDHLWETQKNNLSERNNISLKYKHLIDEQIEEFREWFVKRNKLVLVNK
ncbi:MAG: glutamyl-tRNA reductase, partial [Spirochaetes bacterium GWD1_27_9]